MKNLFDYATKELSQDAFLMWLFANYDDPKIGILANDILGTFCNFEEDERIQELSVEAQWCKVDIAVWFKTNKRENVALFIEDKTYSNEHNQLSVYDSHIDILTDRTIYKIFYKTDFIDRDERTRIKLTNEKNKTDWRIFDIFNIVSLFEKYQNVDNLIVSQYVEHIKNIQEAVTNCTLPTQDGTQIDFLKWEAFFRNAIVPNLISSDNLCWWVSRSNYSYVYFAVGKNNGENDFAMPYLEVRSRDCIGECKDGVIGYFQVRLLCYGVKEEDFYRNGDNLIENIRKSEFICKHLRWHKNGVESFPKQLGYSQKIPVHNQEEFVALAKHYLEEYQKVMYNWH